MSLLRPLKLPHFKVILIWWHCPFKILKYPGPGETGLSCLGCLVVPAAASWFTWPKLPVLLNLAMATCSVPGRGYLFYCTWSWLPVPKLPYVLDYLKCVALVISCMYLTLSTCQHDVPDSRCLIYMIRPTWSAWFFLTNVADLGYFIDNIPGLNEVTLLVCT